MQNGILNEVNKQELPRVLLAENLNGHDTNISNHCERPTRELSYEGYIIVPVENFCKGPEATRRTTMSV